MVCAEEITQPVEFNVLSKDKTPKQPKAKVEPKKDEPKKVEPAVKAKAKPEAKPEVADEPITPTVSSIMKAEDCSAGTAAKILEGVEALAREREFRAFAKKRKDQAHYVCSASRATGYYRIGRHFSMEPTVVFADELTEAQIVEIGMTDPVHMKVKKVGFIKPEQPNTGE